MKAIIISLSILFVSSIAIGQVEVNCAAGTINHNPLDGVFDVEDLQPVVTGTTDFETSYEIFTIDDIDCDNGYCSLDSIVWSIVADGQSYDCTNLVFTDAYTFDDLLLQDSIVDLPIATLPIDMSVGLVYSDALDHSCNILRTYTDQVTYQGAGAQVDREWTFLDWCTADTLVINIVYNIAEVTDNIIFGANWLGQNGNSATYSGLQYDVPLFDCSEAVADSYPDIHHVYCGEGGLYNIPPHLFSNDNHLDGVSTLDLVLIVRHILGIAEFDNPYQYIAADINSNGSISSTDLIEIRKLILGIYTTLPNNSSIVGVTNTIEIESIQYPFPYAEYTLVKIGDVNGSASFNVNDQDQSENRSMISLEMDDLNLQENQSYKVPVRAKDLLKLVGVQSTIEWDTDLIEITDITQGAIDIQADHVNMKYQVKGLMSFLWMSAEANIIEEDDVLFYVHLNAKDNSNLSDAISLGSTLTENVSITDDLQEVTPILVFDTDSSLATSLEIYPNPASDVINIRTADNQSVYVTLMNTQGQVILRKAIENTGKLDIHNIPNGVYLYEITTASGDTTIDKIVIQH